MPPNPLKLIQAAKTAAERAKIARLVERLKMQEVDKLNQLEHYPGLTPLNPTTLQLEDMLSRPASGKPLAYEPPLEKADGGRVKNPDQMTHKPQPKTANPIAALVRGWTAGTGGLGRDAEDLTRLVAKYFSAPGSIAERYGQGEAVLPSTEFYKDWLPGKSMTEGIGGRELESLGSLAGGVGLGTAAKKVTRVGSAIAHAAPGPVGRSAQLGGAGQKLINSVDLDRKTQDAIDMYLGVNAHNPDLLNYLKSSPLLVNPKTVYRAQYTDDAVRNLKPGDVYKFPKSVNSTAISSSDLEKVLRNAEDYGGREELTRFKINLPLGQAYGRDIRHSDPTLDRLAPPEFLMHGDHNFIVGELDKDGNRILTALPSIKDPLHGPLASQAGVIRATGDLQNTGLIHFPDSTSRKAIREMLPHEGPYYTQEEMDAADAAYKKSVGQTEGFSQGGSVYNPARVDEIIAAHRNSEYDPARVDALVAQLKEELYA